MSYLDQFQGPFSDALTAQCRDPVFGHNVMHIPTGGDDPRAFRDERNNPRDTAFFRGGRKGDDGAAIPAHGGATYEIDLSPDAAEKTVAHRIRHYLSGEVHFDRTVDRNHIIILGNDGWIVDILAGMKIHMGMLVHKIIEGLGPDTEGCDGLVPVDAFAGIVDDSLLHQLDHSITEHFGMDTQVTMMVQTVQNRVRDLADTHLQSCSVFDEEGSVFSDFSGHRVHLGRLQFR